MVNRDRLRGLRGANFGIVVDLIEPGAQSGRMPPR
jgi:hypothetical protein